MTNFSLEVVCPLGSQSPYTNHGARTSASHCLPADTHFTQVTHHETPSLHCVLHTLFESISIHDCLSLRSISIAKAFHKGPKRIFPSPVTGHRPSSQVLSRSACECAHLCASPISSSTRTTQGSTPSSTSEPRAACPSDVRDNLQHNADTVSTL